MHLSPSFLCHESKDLAVSSVSSYSCVKKFTSEGDYRCIFSFFVLLLSNAVPADFVCLAVSAQKQDKIKNYQLLIVQ